MSSVSGWLFDDNLRPLLKFEFSICSLHNRTPLCAFVSYIRRKLICNDLVIVQFLQEDDKQRNVCVALQRK